MKRAPVFSRRAGTLIVTLFTLTALSLVAAYSFARVQPRFRMAYQNAAWEEARLASEAGVDAAMGDLLRNLTGAAPDTWPGWKYKDASGRLVPVVPGLLGGVLNTVGGLLSALLGPPQTSGTPASTPPIILDNLNVSTSGGIPSEVDVQLWALRPTSSSQSHWFRIRSLATCGLPPVAHEALEPFDGALRRFSLRAIRPSLRKDDVGAPTTVALPNVSRACEVLVEPILPFELALWTQNSVSLCYTGDWTIDSYDSRDPAKSNAGAWPGLDSPLVQHNGHVGCNHPRPPASPYGPLVAINGMRVLGEVATNGGDDPNTSDHENVSGGIALDQSRVRNDFIREMNPVARPSGGLVLPPPLLGGAFVPGTNDAPSQYGVSGNLGDFRIASPLGGLSGAIVIMVNGNLTLTSALIVPPKVTAVIYVSGNITFQDNVNSGPWSSNRPGQLLIFGDGSGPGTHTVQAYGESTICACLYAPNYQVTLEGGVSWCGSIAAADFLVSSGGDGGVHYDEAVGVLGPPVSFRICRYVEDVRE
jgi:hypothetical protein